MEYVKNSSVDDYEEFPQVAENEVNWPKVVFEIIILLVGVVGNTVVIFVIAALREHRKSVTHWYVLQLAIADSLFLLTLPFKISEDVNGRWIYQKWMCKAKETILFLNCYASILFLVIMSADRYIAVCHTFSDLLQKLHRPLAAISITTAAWVVSFCMCTPVIMYSSKVGNHPYCVCSYHFPRDPETVCRNMGMEKDLRCIDLISSSEGGTEQCRDPNSSHNWLPLAITQMPVNDTEQPLDSGVTTTEAFNDILTGEETPPQCSYRNEAPSWRAFVLFGFIVMFIMPVIIMAVFYGLIVRRLSINDKIMKNAASAKIRRQRASSSSGRDRRRVTMMCAALVTTFVILWLPFHVNHLAKLVGINAPEHVCENLAIAGTLLVYLNSALNPYLYTFLGSNFKRRMSKATRRVRRKNGSLSSAFTAQYTKKGKRRKSSSTTLASQVHRVDRENPGVTLETRATNASTHSQSGNSVFHTVNAASSNEIEKAEVTEKSH